MPPVSTGWMHLSNRSNVPEDAAGIRGWRLTCFVAVAMRAALLAAHCWVDEHTGDLPRVGKVDPVALGVHPAADLGTQQAGEGRLDLPDRVPVYVPRDRDAEVDAALARGGVVVLVGDSPAGKSRAACEAVRRLPG